MWISKSSHKLHYHWLHPVILLKKSFGDRGQYLCRSYTWQCGKHIIFAIRTKLGLPPAPPPSPAPPHPPSPPAPAPMDLVPYTPVSNNYPLLNCDILVDITFLREYSPLRSFSPHCDCFLHFAAGIAEFSVSGNLSVAGNAMHRACRYVTFD